MIQFAVSVAVAKINSTVEGGYNSATFAALWAMFLVIIFAYIGAKVSLKGSSTRLQVGFLIGAASMLSQLFFLLMCYFFVLGNEAKILNYSKKKIIYLFSLLV